MKVSPESKRIGWIGTGVMGLSMCGHLLDKGFAATVYNRTKSKADDLLQRGATWADSPAQAADGTDVAFSIVGSAHYYLWLRLVKSPALPSPWRLVATIAMPKPNTVRYAYIMKTLSANG